jgi:hypothetical protein
MKDRWNKPLPETLQRPTYWPAMLALGITLMLLGPVTVSPVGIAGFVMTVVSLAGWIREMVHE